MNYLVDTNVLSEMRQKRPEPKVIHWLESTETFLYTSVLVMGEIRYGIELLPLDSVRRSVLQRWLDGLIDKMAGRVLSVNWRVAEEWARLQAEVQAVNIILPTVDGLLAATARRYRLTIATHNVRDFKATGVRVFNPFD